jgi:hypothetical protein
MYCPSCGLRQSADHRFCVSCGTRLPRELLEMPGPKVARWFPGIPVTRTENPGKALRVTRYLEDQEITTDEGSVRVPDHHVRFSIWVEDHAVAAVSIPESDAAVLADFLSATVPVN